MLTLAVQLVSCSDRSLLGEASLSNSAVSIDPTEQVAFEPGSTVNLTGAGFAKNVTASIDGEDLALTLIDNTHISFLVPTDLTSGIKTVIFSKAGKELSQFAIVVGTVSGRVPEVATGGDKLCSDVIYKAADGTLKRGERDCSAQKNCSKDGETGCVATAEYPAALIEGLADDVVAHQTVAGVPGTSPTAEPCSNDQAEPCLIDGTHYKALAGADVLATDLKQGYELANVSGSFTGIPENCQNDGQTACIATAAFPAIDKLNAVQANQARFESSLVIAGVSGALPPCAADGAIDCVTTADFPAIEKATQLSVSRLASIRAGVSIAGVSGLLPDCASDGDVSCVAGPLYRAVLTTGANAKIVSGQTFGGVLGTAPARPSDCASDGQAGCVAVANFPAIDKDQKLSGTNLDNIPRSLTIAGVQGQLDNCASDGSSDCLVLGPSFAAGSVAGAAAKILTGQTLAGVAGTAPPRPSDCSSDGGQACTTVTGFPAANASTAAAKILTSQTLAGVSGTTPERPSDCLSDGATQCVTTSNFTAVDAASAAAKIASGHTLAGVVGTGASRPIDCATDGGTACVTVADFPAVDRLTTFSTANKGKFHSSLTLVGEVGSLNDCAADGSRECLTSADFPSASTSGAAPKILTGQVLADVNGTAPLRPADCAVDGDVACVAVTNFPVIDKATKLTAAGLGKIHSSLSLLGLNGSMPSCTVDGQTSCMTVTGMVSALTSGIAAKIALGDKLAGVAGTANVKPSDCSLDGAAGCTTTAGYPALFTTGAAAKIALGETLGGISGTATVRPSDCNLDGKTNCVATTNFPAIDKATHLTAAQMAKVSSNQQVAGVSGTLPDCSADGQTNCFAMGPTFAALSVSGAAAKILSGQTIAGVSGSGAGRPADCAVDGDTNCVTVTAFPAVDKVGKLGGTNPTNMLASLTILGVTGTMNDCAADGSTGCYAIAGFPAAQGSTAAAKILTGQTVAGVAGSAAVRPADCAANAATDCVSVANFPAVDKSGHIQTKLSSISPSLTLLGSTGTMPSCATDGLTGCLANASYVAANTTGIAAKILTGQTLAGTPGTGAGRPVDCAADGATDCVAITNFPAASSVGAAAKILSGQTVGGISGSASARPSDCASDGATGCVAVTNFPAVDKVNKLTGATNRYHTSLTLAGVAGTFADCASDAATNCYAVTAFPAMKQSVAAARILSPLVLGGVTGTAAPRPSDCSGDNQTECVAIAAYPAVVLSNVVDNAAKIKTGVTIAGVAGSMPNCTSDGQTACEAVTGYKAVNASTAAAKILSGQTFGGTAGSAPLRPTSCAAANATACTAVAAFPAAKLANVTAGTLKSGSSLLGVTGSYPSSSYPLANANTGTTDLTTSTFNTFLRAGTTNQWFDSAGNVYTATGDTNMNAANIKSGVTTLGLTGSYAPDCSADGQLNCNTTATYKALKKAGWDGYDILYGTTYAGVDGRWVMPMNRANLSGTNRTTGNGANASTTAADVYDTLSDVASPTTPVSGYAANYDSTTWLRDPNSDTDSDGTCNGSEDCVYVDKLMKRYWAKVPDNTAVYTWEDAITYCTNLSYGGYSGWRIPMEKEAMQARIDGINSVKNILNLTTNTYWTATTQNGTYTKARTLSWMKPDVTGFSDKTSTQRVLCTR